MGIMGVMGIMGPMGLAFTIGWFAHKTIIFLV